MPLKLVVVPAFENVPLKPGAPPFEDVPPKALAVPPKALAVPPVVSPAVPAKLVSPETPGVPPDIPAPLTPGVPALPAPPLALPPKPVETGGDNIPPPSPMGGG